MKYIVLTPLVALGILIGAFALTLLRQAYWDFRVEEMCKVDGGRKIFQTVELSEQEYNSMLTIGGHLDLPSERYAKSSDRFMVTFDDKTITRGFLGLIVDRSVTQIVRLQDNSVIAEQITYGRSGGDFPFSASHSTSFSCPKFEVNLLNEEIFKKQQ